jgi:hypothetical protein
MIRHDPDDENAGTQTASDVFTTFSADILDGERLAQEPLSQCAYFRVNVRDWGQKMSRFQGIYQQEKQRLPYDRALMTFRTIVPSPTSVGQTLLERRNAPHADGDEQ